MSRFSGTFPTFYCARSFAGVPWKWFGPDFAARFTKPNLRRNDPSRRYEVQAMLYAASGEDDEAVVGRSFFGDAETESDAEADAASDGAQPAAARKCGVGLRAPRFALPAGTLCESEAKAALQVSLRWELRCS